MRYLLLGIVAGCGPGVHMTYLHDSNETGDSGIADHEFAFVEGLPVDCPSRPYVKLPPSGSPDRTSEYYEAWEVNEAVRGVKVNWGVPATLYPVVYGDRGWVVAGAWLYSEEEYGFYRVDYEVSQQEPFTLACG